MRKCVSQLTQAGLEGVIAGGSFGGTGKDRRPAIAARRCILDAAGNMNAGTVRKTITLARTTLRYLEKLAEKGTHGSDWSGVARGFVEAGVREAIKDEFIKLGDGQEKD